MTRLLLTGTQPDQSIKLLTMTIEHVRKRIGGVLPVAADPPHLPLRQCIKEAKAEISQIKEQQTAFPEPMKEIEHVYSAVFMDVLAPLQPRPSLVTKIKESNQFTDRKSTRLNSSHANI